MRYEVESGALYAIAESITEGIGLGGERVLVGTQDEIEARYEAALAECDKYEEQLAYFGD